MFNFLFPTKLTKNSASSASTALGTASPLSLLLAPFLLVVVLFFVLLVLRGSSSCSWSSSCRCFSLLARDVIIVHGNEERTLHKVRTQRWLLAGYLLGMEVGAD